MGEETLADVGEKALVGDLLSLLDESGVDVRGDDCGVVHVDGTQLLYNIDRAARPIAIDGGLGGYEVYGRLAIVTNYSDILASGGVPVGSMLSVISPSDETVQTIKDIVTGARDTAATYDAPLVGGDTKEGPELTVVATALGTLGSGDRITRHGATPGDVLVLTGPVGGFAAATVAMLAGETDDPVTQILTQPSVPYNAATTLAETGGATAGMDLSDGLSEALHRITADSGVGAEVYLDDIPSPPLASSVADERDIDPHKLMLFGAGDWQIVYTVDEEVWRTQEDQLRDAGLSKIGVVTDTDEVVGVRDGTSAPLNYVKNEHFVSTVEETETYISKITEQSLYE